MRRMPNPSTTVRALQWMRSRGLGRAQVMTALRVGLGLAGVGALVWLVRDVGPSALYAALRSAATWLPLAALLEGARIGCDCVATRLAYGERARSIPIARLVRAHLIGYAVGSVAPAPRAANEATKAALLMRYAGGPAATAVATTNQAVTLIAAGLVSIPCAWAAYRDGGASVLTAALVVHAVVLTGTGTAIRAAARARGLGGWLGRRFRRIERDTAAFHDAAREAPLLPPGPILAMSAGRVVQMAQYGVLAHAVGVEITAERALLVQGVYLVSIAVGVLVPGQVGVNEGAFTLLANPLGTTTANAMALSLLNRVLTAFWILVGSLTPLVWRVDDDPVTPAPDAPAPEAEPQPEAKGP
jgi:Lysylphosphatidylglycerol synthase TM region